MLARIPDSASLFTFSWTVATCFRFCFSNEAPLLSQRPRCVHSWDVFLDSLLSGSGTHKTVQRQVEQLGDSGLSQMGMGWWQRGGWGRRQSPLGSYFFGSARKTNRVAADVWVIAHSSWPSLLPDTLGEFKSSLSTSACHLNRFYTSSCRVSEVDKLRCNPELLRICFLYFVASFVCPMMVRTLWWMGKSSAQLVIGQLVSCYGDEGGTETFSGALVRN